MARIALIEHEWQHRLGSPYILHELARRWQRQGHSVQLQAGTQTPLDADLAILHVDLTRIPQRFLDLCTRYPKVLNLAASDISKSGFSRLLLKPGDDYRGAVIVKTDANFGGKVDQRLRKLSLKAGMADEVGESTALAEYSILESKPAAEDPIWQLPGLILEKFMPERDERGYYLRVWSFFGRQERSSRYRSEHPLVKAARILDRTAVEVPGALRAVRRKLGFDYGKFDYVFSGGQYYLLDINRSPGAPADLLARPDMAGFLDELALGLDDFVS